MVSVRMMQMPIDEIVDVIAVRHRVVPASRPVHVPRLVPATTVLRRAAVGIALRHLDHVLVDVILVRVMQMTVVQIVDVIAVPHGGVSAAGPVLVRVIGVVGMGAR